MIVEVEDETRDFLTVYKKDYSSKKTDRRKEFRPKPVYPPPLNVLNGPYKGCLNTRRKNATLPLQEQTEDPQDAINRIREKYPRIKEFQPGILPDEDLIERKENEINQTVYQLDYSKGDYSPRVAIYSRWKDIPLPEDWVISETIQKKSYRNPWKIATKDLLRAQIAKKPPDNLVPSIREREILRVRTGDTEYDATIDVTGNRVMKERLHGPPLSVKPRIYRKGPDSPRSECSEILAKERPMLPSHVF